MPVRIRSVALTDAWLTLWVKSTVIELGTLAGANAAPAAISAPEGASEVLATWNDLIEDATIELDELAGVYSNAPTCGIL